MEATWYKFQESICNHLKKLGLIAKTNAKIKGVRSSHDIDVFATSNYLGQKLDWIVEAKYLNKRVSKLHVLALRTIVDDTGVNTGYIISNKGFQKGAIESAENTNVKLYSFEQFIFGTTEYVEFEILKTYRKRLELIEKRYWSHTKCLRIKYGLREDFYDYTGKFVGQIMLMTMNRIIQKGLRNEYPIESNSYLGEQIGALQIENFRQLQNWLNNNMNHFDEKLLHAEWKMYSNGDYNPDTEKHNDGIVPSDLMSGNINNPIQYEN